MFWYFEDLGDIPKATEIVFEAMFYDFRISDIAIYRKREYNLEINL